jgi:two-component system phosphate regulon sensor histidine kinase PhoR
MTGTLFRRLLLLALALVALTVWAVDSTLAGYLSRQETDSAEERLTAEARLLANELARLPQNEWPARMHKASAIAGARIAIDSADENGNTGEVRAMAPLTAADGSRHVLQLTGSRQPLPYSGRLRLRVLGISLGAAFLALFLAFLISRSLSLQVRSLKRLAEGILEGSRDYAPVTAADGDLRSLGSVLAVVAKEVRSLLVRLSFESARREAILSGMAEGVLALDQDLRVTFSNNAFRRTLGVPASAIEGRTLLELIRDTALHHLLHSVVASGEGQSHRLKLAGSNLRVFEVQATPLNMPSGRGAIVIFHDTTELERLEQVRKDFVANVSHELRTPLAGIIGYAETLQDGAMDDLENRGKFVEIIRSNAMRLTNIAADLLVLSDLESEREGPEPEEISVQGVLDSVLLTVESEAQRRNVRLIRGEMADVFLQGSRLRVEQVLLNLMANAIKFNRPDGEVRVSALKTSEGSITISVADTGVGIPSQDLPRVFERFYRVDKARSKDVGGTGLGLSIVKHAVERMNGTVQVKSKLGEGSVFTVTLPVAND